MGYGGNQDGAFVDYSIAGHQSVRVSDPRIAASELLTLSERAFASPSSGNYAGGDYRSRPATGNNTGLLLHGRAANVSFLDGHGESRDPIDYGFDPQRWEWVGANASGNILGRPWFHRIYTAR